MSKTLLDTDARHIDRATFYLNRAAEAGSSRAYRNLAWIHLLKGETETASGLLTRADGLGVEDVSAYWQLGLAYWRAGASEAAAEAWKRVVRGESERLYTMLWTLMGVEGPGGDLPSVMIALGEDAIALDPARVYPYILLGQMYRNFDLEASDHWFQEALLHSPENAEALASLAENALGQGRREEALAYLDRARDGYVESAAVYSSMARLYVELERPETAAALYRKAVERYPDLSYQRALANVYYQMGQHDEAKAVYEAILERAPGDTRAQERLQSIRALVEK